MISCRDEKCTDISVELADEAGEVVVFEVVGEEVTGELRRAPNDKSGVVFTPRDDVVGGGIIDELICLGQKWGRN